MVRLSKWEDIAQNQIRQSFVEQQISASTVYLLRTLESIFEGKNSHVQAHQCLKCGNLFMMGEDRIVELKDDGQGGKLCKLCAGQEDPNQEKVPRWKKLGEITNVIRAWEKATEGENEKFLKIKEVAKECFDFTSIREMYVNYRNFSDQVKNENKELGHKLKENYTKILDDVFKKIKADNTEEFVKFVYGVNYAEETEIQETINMLEASTVRGELEYWLPKVSNHAVLSIGIKTKEGLDRLRFKLILLQYGQLVEFGFIYDTLYNLAILLQGEKFIENPFPPDQDGNPIFPHEKIRLIEEKNSDLAKIVKEYFVNVLRNAIAHTKYQIKDDFVYKSDKKNWKMSKKQVKDKMQSAKNVFRYLLNELADEQANLMRGPLVSKNNDTFSVQFSDEETK